jgi:predicted nucleotidyltransferase
MVAAAKELEKTKGVRIMWLVESGSGTWDVHSPDSDYDGRGVFVPEGRPAMSDALAALGLADGAGPGDITWFSDDRQCDINLWTLDKMIRLLGDGKSIALEWMRSPIVYMNTDGWLERMRAATECAGAAGGRGASMAQFVGQLSTALHQNARDQRCVPAAVKAAHTATDGGVAMLHRFKLACLSGDPDLRNEARAGVLSALDSVETAAASAPTTPTLTLKTMAHALRPALNLAWMAQHAEGLPPIGVQTTLSQLDLPDDIAPRIGAVLAAKRCAVGKTVYEERDEVLDAWILAQRRWAIGSGSIMSLHAALRHTGLAGARGAEARGASLG